jgi:hypothetical protein
MGHVLFVSDNDYYYRMCHTAIKSCILAMLFQPFEAQWQVYAEFAKRISNAAFLCFVFRKILSVKRKRSSFNQLSFAMEECCVFFEKGTEFLKIFRQTSASAI